MKAKLFLIVLIIVSVPEIFFAQQRIEKMAFAGPNGIFINTGKFRLAPPPKQFHSYIRLKEVVLVKTIGQSLLNFQRRKIMNLFSTVFTN